MTTNNSFSFESFNVVTGEHKVEIILNDEFTKTIPVKNARQVRGFMSAISNIVLGRFPHVVDGEVYLHATMEELSQEITRDNAGYASAAGLRHLIDSGLAARTREIVTGWYRLNWDGMRFTTAYMPYVQYTEGESEGEGGPRHNRNAINMLDAMVKIERARVQGVNIRLVFNDKLVPWVNAVLESLKPASKGKVDKAKELYATKVASAGVKRTMYHLTKAVEAGEDVVVKAGATVFVREQGAVDANSLVGQVVQYFAGGVALSNPPFKVTTENVPMLVKAASTHGVQVGIVEEEAA